MTTASADVAEEDANIAFGVACEGASKNQRIQKVVAPSTTTMVIPTGHKNLPGKTLRRLRSMANAYAYVTQKHEDHAPLGEADPLELQAPDLTTGSLNVQHEPKIFSNMLARQHGHQRISSGRILRREFPNEAESRVEELFQKYKAIF